MHSLIARTFNLGYRRPAALLLVALALTALLFLLFLPGSQPAQALDADADFALDSDNPVAEGIWGNADTIWVANDGTGAENKVFAYNRSDGDYDSSQDFETLHGAGNLTPEGIWSDGTTMYVADSDNNKVYAYKMLDQTHDSGKDFNLHGNNDRPRGITGYGGTLWVVQDAVGSNGNRIFAYKLNPGQSDHGAREPGKELNKLDAADNRGPAGIWTDGATMYVADPADDKVYAYKMSNRSRDRAREFDLDAENGDPRGIWADAANRFDAKTFYVADHIENKLYVYTVTPADIDGPVLLSAVVNTAGAEIALTFDEGLDTTTWTSAYRHQVAVTVDGQAVTFADVDFSGSLNETATLSGLSLVISAGQTVVVAFTDPTSGNDPQTPFQDVLGNDAASFTTGVDGVSAVRHGSSVDTTPIDTGLSTRLPRKLLARVVGGGVELKWSAPTQDAASVEGYEILRRRSNRGEQTFTTLVSDTGDADTAYLDATAIEAGVRYTYRVEAIRSGQRSGRSNAASVLLLGDTTPRPLVGNIGQSPSAEATITDDYTMLFRLGTHGQGYAIDSVSIDLAAAPTDLTVSVWIAGIPGASDAGGVDWANERRYKLFDFANPDSFQAGLNTFAAPAGAWVYHNVNHYIVLSDFGDSLEIKETTSNAEDPGGEPGAILADEASSRSGVLRLVLEGSRRDRGILAAAFAQPGAGTNQEIISLGDDCCFEMTLGAPGRYLIRSLSVYGDDSTPLKGIFDLPINVIDLFNLTMPDRSTHQVPGMNLFTAPQGAILLGGDRTYTLEMDIVDDPGSTSLRGGVILSRVFGNASVGFDTPSGGATFSQAGDVALISPIMAIEGEALHPMVSNFGQIDDSYKTVDSTTPFVSQGFTTGSESFEYHLQGIGVNIEGSDDSNGNAQIPDGPSSVSVAVHADASGQPGDKLFDLVSPDDYTSGHSFFEAPPGTTLAPNTSYVLAWKYLSGTAHRLRRTASDSEDSGALAGFSIADAFYSGSALSSLSVASGGRALEIVLYGVAVDPPALGYQVTPNWLHIPDGVEVGDQFRLVFISTTNNLGDAMSGDVEDYNALVQREAAREYNDSIIRRVASEFKAVVCTETVDARRNTNMTDSRGVPVHWLDGGWDDRPTLIADSYADFYEGEWVNREWGALVTGNSTKFYPSKLMWTGCDATGASHPDAHVGTTSSMGVVALGAPNHTNPNYAPLGANFIASEHLSAEKDESYRLYAVSPVFTVVPAR